MLTSSQEVKVATRSKMVRATRASSKAAVGGKAPYLLNEALDLLIYSAFFLLQSPAHLQSDLLATVTARLGAGFGCLMADFQS